MQNPLKGRHPLKPPVLVIRLRQIAELHKNIDEAKVSLLLQQLGRDRAEGSLKVLAIPCHELCDSFSPLSVLRLRRPSGGGNSLTCSCLQAAVSAPGIASHLRPLSLRSRASPSPLAGGSQ